MECPQCLIGVDFHNHCRQQLGYAKTDSVNISCQWSPSTLPENLFNFYRISLIFTGAIERDPWHKMGPK